MPAPTDKGIKVEIFKLANHLKARMGARFERQKEAFLAPEAIVEADKLIADLCETSPQTMTALLQALTDLWAQMRVMPEGPERHALGQKVFMQAHEIKDIGAMCGYELVAHFAESLRDYVGRSELNISAQLVIIQAHIDAMQAVMRQNIKSDAGPKAEELKAMVKIAIGKYQ